MIRHISGDLYELDPQLAEIIQAAATVKYGRCVIELHQGRPTDKFELHRFVKTTRPLKPAVSQEKRAA